MWWESGPTAGVSLDGKLEKLWKIIRISEESKVMIYTIAVQSSTIRNCRHYSNTASCICSAPPTVSPMAHSIVSGRCMNRNVLRWRLNVAVDRMSFSSVLNRFQAHKEEYKRKWAFFEMSVGVFSVIFVNKNENENVEKRENNEFVNENENENEKMMKTKTKLKRKNRKRLKTKTKKIENENENENAKAKLVTQRKCQHTIRRSIRCADVM